MQLWLTTMGVMECCGTFIQHLIQIDLAASNLQLLMVRARGWRLQLAGMVLGGDGDGMGWSGVEWGGACVEWGEGRGGVGSGNNAAGCGLRSQSKQPEGLSEVGSTECIRLIRLLGGSA